METEVTMDRETHRPISAVTVLACAWPALLLATACLLPFLNKPFLIDDPHFLMMARQIVMHPMLEPQRRLHKSLSFDARECPDGVRAGADSCRRRP
jgi:hypothetical protein